MTRKVLIFACTFNLFCGSAWAGDWQYRSYKDEMRNTSTNVALVLSENCQSFAFPYDGCHKLALGIRYKQGKLDEVYFFIPSGQFNCGIDECRVAIKFDSGTVGSVTLLPSADYDPKYVWAKNDAWLLKKINGASKLMIELPFYQEGNRQFTFDVSGRNTKYPN